MHDAPQIDPPYGVTCLVLAHAAKVPLRTQGTATRRTQRNPPCATAVSVTGLLSCCLFFLSCLYLQLGHVARNETTNKDIRYLEVQNPA